MTNAVWEWAIESGLSAFELNGMFNGPDAAREGPCWCFDRYGRSVTPLPDGRTVYIAGEHEDHYDPDFYIYNDLVVRQASGELAIYGYPVDDFPPTDFHSATLVPDQILLIGSLGYPDGRFPGKTQVLAASTETWSVSAIETSGDSPGWIHDHTAQVVEGGSAILLAGGKVQTPDEPSLIDNIDDWRLDLSSFEWSRLTERPWCQFEIRRKDRNPNGLWELRQSLFEKQAGWLEKPLSRHVETKLRMLPTLYAPKFADEVLGETNDEYGTHRILVQGVVVRFFEDMYGIQVTVEGNLPDSTKQDLKDDLAAKVSALEDAEIECFNIRG